MAARVAGSCELVVWNRSPAPAAAFQQAHPQVTVAASLRDLAASADIVITCLTTSQAVEECLDGADGLLAGLRPGSLLVDCTSGSPDISRRIAARLAPAGVGYADAPVSGGTAGAVAGTLTVMVGCEPELFARVEAAVAPFAGKVVLMGPVGAGDAMKAVNNALLAANLIAAGEGMAVLAKFGVSPAEAAAVLNQSTGRSFVTEKLFPERVLNGSWPRTFRLALLHKDVAIAADLGGDLEVATPVLRAALDELGKAKEQLDQGADHVELVKVIESRSGVTIRE